jgi:hypothetical protein
LHNSFGAFGTFLLLSLTGAVAFVLATDWALHSLLEDVRALWLGSEPDSDGSSRKGKAGTAEPARPGLRHGLAKLLKKSGAGARVAAGWLGRRRFAPAGGDEASIAVLTPGRGGGAADSKPSRRNAKKAGEPEPDLDAGEVEDDAAAEVGEEKLSAREKRRREREAKRKAKLEAKAAKQDAAKQDAAETDPDDEPEDGDAAAEDEAQERQTPRVTVHSISAQKAAAASAKPEPGGLDVISPVGARTESNYRLPPLELLERSEDLNDLINQEGLQRDARAIEHCLGSRSVKARGSRA